MAQPPKAPTFVPRQSSPRCIFGADPNLTRLNPGNVCAIAQLGAGHPPLLPRQEDMGTQLGLGWLPQLGKVASDLHASLSGL